MPEHAERERPGRILDRFHRPVLGVGACHEPLPQAPEALVVVRLHGRVLPEQRAHARPGVDLDVVVGERAGRVLVLVVADQLGQVLLEVAAACDVQDLAAAADREHR